MDTRHTYISNSLTHTHTHTHIPHKYTRTYIHTEMYTHTYSHNLHTQVAMRGVDAGSEDEAEEEQEVPELGHKKRKNKKTAPKQQGKRRKVGCLWCLNCDKERFSSFSKKCSWLRPWVLLWVFMEQKL